MMDVALDIREKLQNAFDPLVLDIENESYKHNVPEGSQSHFKVIIVSAAFEDKRQVPCHQMIYKVLSQELAGPVHALSLHTYSPNNWKEQRPNTPDCMG
jgi:BolA protein